MKITDLSPFAPFASEYVNAMQLSDLVSGAIKDYFTGKNKNLKKTIDKKYLHW